MNVGRELLFIRTFSSLPLDVVKDQYLEGCSKQSGYLPGCTENEDGSVDCYCYEPGCNTKEMIDTWIQENYSSKTNTRP